MQVLDRLIVRGWAAMLNRAPLAIARKAVRMPLLAPVYHLTAEQPPPHIRYLFPVRNRRTFSDDLDFLQRYGEFVTLEQLHQHVLAGAGLPKNAIFLSFDDGLREVTDHIAPELYQRGIPATFFLNQGFIDNEQLFYRHKASLLCDRIDQLTDNEFESLGRPVQALQPGCFQRSELKQSILRIEYSGQRVLDELAEAMGVNFGLFLRDQQPYLTSEQVRNVLNQGFTIGAHSVDHPRYSMIPLDEQIRQTRQSVMFLCEKFGIGTRDLAFPFTSTDVSEKFFNAVYRDNLIDMLFCLDGIAVRDTRNIERCWMERSATAPAAQIVREFYIQSWKARRHDGAKP